MKNFCYSFLTVAVVAFSSCSAEDAIADAKTAETNNVYQRRIEWLQAQDFTTLFSYKNTDEVKDKMPGALNKVISNVQHRLPLEKGATEAIIKIVVEDGKGILWEKHFIDAPNKRLVELIRKKEDSHVMYIGSRDNYPVVYNEITEAMESLYSSLGSLTDSTTTLAINDYLSKRLTTQNSAEYRIRITDSSAEIYALK